MRGGFDLNKIVDGIVSRGYTQIYAIGRDGTMRGAVAIFEEFKRCGLNISITGIPKTVDNDIGIIDRSFGFQTAVEIAQQAIDAAHVEAVSAVNGQDVEELRKVGVLGIGCCPRTREDS